MSETDLIDRLADLAPGSPLAVLRVERPDVVRHTQGAYEALIAPAEPAEPGLSLVERAAIARDVAVANRDDALAAHYAALVADRGGPPSGTRWSAVATHVAMVAAEPRQASREALDRLRSVGLGEAEIVTLSQLVAFVSYQTRLLTGLRLMEDARG